LKRNDPTLTKIDKSLAFSFPDRGHGQRLGAALQRNTVVTELSLCLSTLLCPKHVTTSQTHSVMLLMQFIKDSPSLRKVQLCEQSCTLADSLTQLILEAMLHNPGILSLDIDILNLPVLKFLETRPMLVSLKFKTWYNSFEELHAAGCAIAALERLETLVLVLDTNQHLFLFLQPLVGHGTLHRLRIHCRSCMERDIGALRDVFGNSTLQYLVLRSMFVNNAQWKILAQGFQSRASSCTVLPLQSVSFEECYFDEGACVAMFSGYTSTGSTVGGQLQQSSACLCGTRSLKLVNCTFGHYYCGHTFPNVSGFLSTTVLLTRFALHTRFHPTRAPIHLLPAFLKNGSLCKVSLRSTTYPETTPWRNARHYIRAIMARNKRIPQILTNIGENHDDGCRNRQLVLVPTLFAVAFPACRMAPNSLLTGLLAIPELGSLGHAKRSLSSLSDDAS
jgi:hypothetical protein